LKARDSSLTNKIYNLGVLSIALESKIGSEFNGYFLTTTVSWHNKTSTATSNSCIILVLNRPNIPGPLPAPNTFNHQVKMVTTETKTYLVAGASRGIGLELARQLAFLPNTIVYAAMRRPVAIATPGNNIIPLQLDQTSDASVAAAAAAAQVPAALHGLFLNAAMGEDERLLAGPAAPARLASYLDVIPRRQRRGAESRRQRTAARTAAAAVGGTGRGLPPRFGAPHRAALVVRGLHRRPGRRDVWPAGPLRLTKAATNMLVVQWHNELLRMAEQQRRHTADGGDEEEEEDGFVVVSVHPGWVDTEMGRVVGDGGMSVADSAAALIRLEQGLTREDSTHFYDWQGRNMDW
jgi:NAD(P)-dependent dehydrogenase (short-subunit alcohol dehydrogenase family)